VMLTLKRSLPIILTPISLLPNLVKDKLKETLGEVLVLRVRIIVVMSSISTSSPKIWS
jgi:hypothetical protein